MAADRAAVYGIPSEVVDGNDVVAVNEAAARAIARARAGEGATILELKTYRHGGHARNDACGYRPKTAIVMILCGVDAEEAARLLKQSDGRIANVLKK